MTSTTTWASGREAPRGLLRPDVRAARRSVPWLAAVPAMLLAAPLGAQEYDAGSFLESLDAQVLIPVTAGLDEAGRGDPGGRLPGFRIAARGELAPGWTTHAGVMRLAPMGASLFGGVVGAGRSFALGALDVSVGAEAVAGRASGLYVASEWTDSEGGTHARLGETSGTAFGAGVTSAVEWRFTSRIGVRAMASYWSLGGGESVPEAGGLYLGGGLTWLTGGLFAGDAMPAPAQRPTSGILIRILEPTGADGERGIVMAEAGSRRVIGLVRDLSGAGVQAVRVNGQLASLTAPDEHGVRFIGFVPGREGVVPVEVTAETADGRIEYKVFRLQLTDELDEDDDGPVPQRFAVVIGVSEYADPLVPDLNYADDDARAFHEFLASERSGLGGIPDENMVLLVNEDASYRNLRSALFSFLRRATENDIVYVYVAAHGVPDPNRPEDLYLLPADAEASDLPGTALRMADVNEAIGRLTTAHTVVFTDACHSGGLGTIGFTARSGLEPNDVNALFLRGLRSTAGGLAIFTAAEARQISREGRQWGGGHGAFTHHLLEGLNGAADTDDDSIVRLGEVMEYVREHVRRDTQNAQIPAIGGFAHDRELPLAIIPEET